MNNKKNAFLILATSVMFLTSCGGTPVGTTTVTGDYMPGAVAKLTYNSLLSSTYSSLNYHKTQEAADGQHIANFVDGLLANDQYGRLVKALASNVTKNVDYTEFTFTIRENVPWVTYDGTQYVSVATGAKQYVCAEDFITTAKSVLDYATESDTIYMVTMFIEGTVEYVSYTALAYKMATDENFAKRHQTPSSQATWMTEWISTNYPDKAVTVNKDNLEDIKNFKRVGIKVNESGQLVYTLTQSAPFFPTMLTYSPFLPTNADFLAQHPTDFGSSKDTILYDGPFRLTTASSSQVVYSKNVDYWDAGNVHVDTVNYKVLSGDIANNTTRLEYENGVIDGFTLNSKDTDGWKKYVTGTDGKGTIENPSDPYVNSRYYDNVDSTWHMTLNVNRSNSIDGGTSASGQKSNLSDVEIHNANIALKIKNFREALLESLDFSVFNEQFGDLEIEQEQYQLNTFIPKGFVFDDTNKDYVEYYYAQYAEEKGITVEQAKAILAPGQYQGVNKTVSEMAALRTKMVAAIELYNAESSADISLPIKIENMSLGGISDDNYIYDENYVNSMNARLNGCTLKSSLVTEDYPLCSGGSYPYVEVSNNINYKAQDAWSAAVQSGYDNLCIWGWGADYGDPLSYLNCYTTDGDMAFCTGTTKPSINYYLNEAGTALVKEDEMLAKYDTLVEAASAQTQSFSIRYETFAQAEYELLNNTYIIRPLYNQGQGWRASVSKALGYDTPQSGYGLASYRLTGLWVLYESPVTKEQRSEMFNLYTSKKEAAIKATGMIAIY